MATDYDTEPCSRSYRGIGIVWCRRQHRDQDSALMANVIKCIRNESGKAKFSKFVVAFCMYSWPWDLDCGIGHIDCTNLLLMNCNFEAALQRLQFSLLYYTQLFSCFVEPEPLSRYTKYSSWCARCWLFLTHNMISCCDRPKMKYLMYNLLHFKQIDGPPTT